MFSYSNVITEAETEMPRPRSIFIQSDTRAPRSPRAFTCAGQRIAPPASSRFSVSVVLPASGCEMIANVRRRCASCSGVRAMGRGHTGERRKGLHRLAGRRFYPVDSAKIREIHAMKLFYSPTSPYARKCRVVAIEMGVEAQIEIIASSPMASGTDLLSVNPLSKVPALALPDGRCIVDSRVICQFLDGLADGRRVIPSDPVARIDCLTREALADGITDAAFLLTMERKRPSEQQSPEWIGRWIAAIRRTVAHFNVQLPQRSDPDLGDIALACALGYLDLRHTDLAWRSHAPALADWFTAISHRHSLASTVPPAA
jgi:glutathione S-transferase